jgi:hypothetical protein
MARPSQDWPTSARLISAQRRSCLVTWISSLGVSIRWLCFSENYALDCLGVDPETVNPGELHPGRLLRCSAIDSR